LEERAASPRSMDPEAFRASAVILVHYGTPVLTARCLRSLAERETMPHRAIVVDHGPGADLAADLRGIHPHLTILRNPSNPGYGPGCNRGAALALEEGAENLWFINNDVIVTEPLLAILADLAARHPSVALWGTHQKDGPTRRGADCQSFQCEAAPAPPALDLPPGCRILGPRETLCGASIFLRREAWRRLGPWPEDYFLYLEDTAWCMRAHREGLPMAITDLEVTHARSSTIGIRSRLGVFYGVRNQLRLHRELMPGAGLRRLIKAFHLLQKRVFQGRWALVSPTFLGLVAAFLGRSGRDPNF